jgi:hypothetical protein
MTTTAALACAIALGQATTAYADPNPTAVAANNSGLLSGNNIQVPIQVPVNLCGNSINVLALLNPASGSECQNS